MPLSTFELVFSAATGLLVVYGALLLAAIWVATSLKNQVLLHPRLWGNLPENKLVATTQALFYVFAGAYFTCALLGARVVSFILFVPFVVCVVIRFRQRFNHPRGNRQA